MEGLAYRIKSIKILEKALYENRSKSKDFGTEITISISPKPAKDLVVLIIKVTIEDKKKQKQLATLKVAFMYEVKGLSNLETTDKKAVRLPEMFEVVLVSISYSTMRGIMFSEFQGTYLQDIILPIVDPKQLVSKKNESKQ